MAIPNNKTTQPVMGSVDDNDTTITKQELNLLDTAGAEKEQDELNRENAKLDDTDDDGEALNESDDMMGEDLDVPGAELDDDNELIGEEDEENNSYSNADQGDA